MRQRALALPLRLASSARAKSRQWVCKRCFATQAAETTTSGDVAVPPVYGDSRLPASERIDPSTGRPTPLSPVDRMLKKPLRQFIPQQYLQHSKVEWLHDNEKAQREKVQPHRKIVGVVVSTGKMEKTVKVRVPGQRWEPRIRKYFADHTNHLVHDPNNSLVVGDVVELHRLHVSKAVHHVVGDLVTPYGIPRTERPPVPTPDERLAAYKEKRFAKLDRRDLRREAAQGNAEAIQKLEDMGLDPGHGVEAGKSEKGSLQATAGKTKDSGKGALLGQKGEKLPKGVLPGGKHEVRRVDERAERNKGQAMRLNEKAEENLLGTRAKVEESEGHAVGVDAASSTSIPRGRVD